MAEPTLKAVLNAVAKIDARLSALEKGQTELRADVVAHRAETAAHRKETAKGFDELDAELEKHASRAHRDLDARIGRLEKRTAPKKVSARPLRRR